MLSKLLKIHKAYFLVLTSTALIFFAFISVKIYLAQPAFLQEIKDSILENKILSQQIGKINGYEINYDPTSTSKDTLSFNVKIIGKCDSAYISIQGIYFNKNKQIKYIIQDTTIINKCQ